MDKIVDTREKKTRDGTHKEALDRFRLCCEAEQANRSEGREDLEMIAGRGHWPDNIQREREQDGRPVVTVNRLPSFVDQVVNDSRLNKVSINVKPYSGGATQEIAEILGGIIRNIENESNAEAAYQTALDGAVQNGFGYIRVVTSYCDETTFDQEIKIKRVKNPMTVYLDPVADEVDARDARFGFVTEMISEEEYKVRYPRKDPPAPIDDESVDITWFGTEHRVRVAEYWVKRPVQKRLYLLSDGRTVNGDDYDKVKDDMMAEYEELMQQREVIASQMALEGQQAPPPPEPPPSVEKERVVDTHRVEHYLIDGNKIIEGPTPWLGKYIPIAPVWGKELIIDNERILKSLIRDAKDPQRLYNYFRAASAETVALAPKAPWVVAEGQIDGYEDDWDNANRKNISRLTYRAVPNVPPPQRQVVTQTALGEITETNIASDEIKVTTSLHNASLGMQGNEVSGRAIEARMREGDVANYTFHDNRNRAVKFIGDILVDLIPRVYDTARLVPVMTEDEQDMEVLVNQVIRDAATGEEVVINDLTQGRYKVVVTAGPSFTTQRVEAAQSMLDFIRVAPDAATMMIDLVAENMDWPGASKIAKRMRKFVAQQFPGIDQEGPPQPPPPSDDDMIKRAKLESISLGNVKKQQDIVEQRRELTGRGVKKKDAAG